MKHVWHWVCVTIALFALSARVGAQATHGDVAREIDTQVWIPLLRASNHFDAKGFLAVQSRDLVRVSVDTSEIYGMDRYARELDSGFERARERGIKRRSEVRFLTRTHSGVHARDTGIFRSEVILPGGEVRVRYTAFEMILRKEAGVWKLLVDRDTAQNGAITEEDYLKGTQITSIAQ